MSAIRPNFFIVGAAKCGTTSLARYLDQHPQVFMSPVKEPYYFGSDLDMADYWRTCDPHRYFFLFTKAGDAKAIGEASVWYLYSTQAAREIKSFIPDARIIVMLRNPCEMVYSLHGQFLTSFNAEIVDFREALAAEADRRQGKRIPVKAHFPGGLQYTAVASFSDQVARYFDVFGREKVHVVMFEDFVGDTSGAYRKVLDFLNVDPSFTPDFSVANPSQPIRVTPAERFVKGRPRLQRAVLRTVPSVVRKKLNHLLKLGKKPLDRETKLPPDLRTELQERFAEEVTRLEGVLKRDLSHWKQG